MILKDLHNQLGATFFFNRDVKERNRAIPYVIDFSEQGYYMKIVGLEDGLTSRWDEDADILNEEISQVKLALVQM
jgi:hypothetical protein